MGNTATIVATVMAGACLLTVPACDLLGNKEADPAPEAATKEPAPAGSEPAGDSPEPQAGDPGDVAEAVEGPTVAWSIDGSTPSSVMRVSADGSVVAVYGDKMVGYVDGSEAWSKTDAYTELVRLADGKFLATAGAKVVAFDPATGSSSFETAVPAPDDATPPRKKDDEEPAPGVVGAETFGSQVLLALEDARFFIVDPPACEREEPACLRPAGLLEGEFLEPAAVLRVNADGTRFLGEDDALRAFDLALGLKFELSAHSDINGITAVGNNRLALAFGGEIALLDTERCSGRLEIRLARNGANVAPKGCVLWRYGGELDQVAPAVIDEATLAANGNQRMQAVINGTDSWKSPLGAQGRVVSGAAGQLYTMTVEEADDGSMSVAVVGVDAEKGTVAWSADLPFAVEAGGVVVVDSLGIDWQGGYVAASLDNQIAVVAIPEPDSEAPDTAAEAEDEGSADGE